MSDKEEQPTQEESKAKRRMKLAWEVTKIVSWFVGSLITTAVFGSPIPTKEELEKEEEEKRREEERQRLEREEAERAEAERRAAMTPEQRKIEDLEKELAKTNRRCDRLQNELNTQNETIDRQRREMEDMDYQLRHAND